MNKPEQVMIRCHSGVQGELARAGSDHMSLWCTRMSRPEHVLQLMVWQAQLRKTQRTDQETDTKCYSSHLTIYLWPNWVYVFSFLDSKTRWPDLACYTFRHNSMQRNLLLGLISYFRTQCSFDLFIHSCRGNWNSSPWIRMHIRKFMLYTQGFTLTVMCNAVMEHDIHCMP